MRDCKYCGKPFMRSRPDQNKQDFCSLACRLWAKVDKSAGPDACWPWTAKSKHYFGYGLLNTNGKVECSHRLAWTITHGVALTTETMVCHKCDNPACCNPAHLFLGDAKANSLDMTRKGRHGSRTLPDYGERISRGKRNSMRGQYA